MLTTIAKQRFDNPEHRLYWISLLSVESKFDQAAKSPVGAQGLSQLMPQYRNDFAKLCGFGEVTEKDLLDAYTNAFIGACVFKSIIEEVDGSLPLAMIIYNAGKSSYGARQGRIGEAPAAESAAYVTKIMLRKQLNKEID